MNDHDDDQDREDAGGRRRTRRRDADRAPADRQQPEAPVDRQVRPEVNR
ncbi:hypothetical protein [Micromonospora yangpuensis]|uniref:Uncharacterized protein n=1 Tax=Micromonospora yangpuensis TaxID=683228 RepID=A0A1C6VDY7_9ACTN|nr:hypothetical protein [Micromonospora yangpuensis]SCL64552.1 hypothetical protein GA0070617_5500 [Micromonospora yangpuensis]